MVYILCEKIGKGGWFSVCKYSTWISKYIYTNVGEIMLNCNLDIYCCKLIAMFHSTFTLKYTFSVYIWAMQAHLERPLYSRLQLKRIWYFIIFPCLFFSLAQIYFVHDRTPHWINENTHYFFSFGSHVVGESKNISVEKNQYHFFN